MNNLIRSELKTQKRVIDLFTDNKNNSLNYRYLGNWSDRKNNRNIELKLLSANLSSRGYSDTQISSALQKLERSADTTGITLNQANLRTYQLLRYGIKIQTSVNEEYKTIHLIDWQNVNANDFAIAEEVTLRGGHERRPDLVIYINGIAIAVIELKRSSVEVGDGIRQLISNQEEIFNMSFFSTVQFLLAGSDSQGLYYGTTKTLEKFFIKWKDESTDLKSTVGTILDTPLSQICEKNVLLDLIRNFIIFDAGQKKVPYPHQYAGVKAAQARIKKGEGGIIWHSQGSGKSILMVLLAKWILESDYQARILIVTDRDELDRQIEGIMKNTNIISEEEKSPRITSRAELLENLKSPIPRLLSALLHKFDPSDMEGELPKTFGKFYVFVDECHRTQGGEMNKQMKRWLSKSIFIGFTGTPLLRKDKKTSTEMFGSYIHTYKFHEAVADKVVLDLKYESREVPQKLANENAINAWFEEKTKGLNNFQKAVVRKQWASHEKLMSSKERKERIIASIIEDFSLKPRLNNNRGTAILVVDSIYDACHYFRLFKQNTNFGQYVGIVTSFEPNHNLVSRETPDSDERYKYDTYTQYVLNNFSNAEKYEIEIKRRFIYEPANTKLLIVVSKLLTGFDAPSCTYIYLDDELRDHNLFQAICRTNRLDGSDKDYGYIVDFKKLFKKVQEAISVYSSDELDISGPGKSDNIELKDWIIEGKKQLDEKLEELKYLCQPVSPPQEIENFLEYFCGKISNPNSLHETEALRISFYKAVSNFVRAYGSIAGDLERAGYSILEINKIKNDIIFFSDLRSAIKKHSGEELDVKPFEADMRHLINTYVHAESASSLGNLQNLSLTELIIQTGINDVIARNINEKNKLPTNVIAETIINNIRQTIVREQLTDPRFYKEISKLLEDLIKKEREDSVSYEKFLINAEEIIKKIGNKDFQHDVPKVLNGNKNAAVIYRNLSDLIIENINIFNNSNENNLKKNDILAKLSIDIDVVMREQAPSGWRGDDAREAQVLNFLFPLLNRNRADTHRVFEFLKNNLKSY
jgi:type I restriction enzyme R subunit